MSTDLHEVLARGAARPTHAPDVATIWEGGRRRRARRNLASGVAALVIAGGVTAGVLTAVTGDNSGTGSTHVAVAPDDTRTIRDAAHGLSIEIPPSWQAAPSTLTPVLSDPIVPLAVGTYPLDDPQQMGECDIVPQRALDALGTADAFIAVYLYQGPATFGSTLERPAHFTPDLFTPGSIQCTENVKGTVSSLGFLDHGRKVSVMVAIGRDASPERRAEVYRILDTLAVTP